jgi:YVTN family beta-propeller protein
LIIPLGESPTMRRFVAPTVALLLSLCPVALDSARAAMTPSGFAINLPTFRHVLADGHGHVYLTGGPGTTGILVRRANGAANTTVSGESGANGMALSPDGSTLYVALTDANAIAAINTSTLAETARYSTGSGTCPAEVLQLADKVWFGDGCSGSGYGIGVVDLTTSTVTTGVATTSAIPLLAGGAAAPNVLFAGTSGGSDLTSYTVSGDTLTLAHSVSIGENLAQLALSADGSQVLTASGGEYDIARYDVSTLGRGGQYGNNYPYPDAVVVAPAGPVVAGFASSYDKDVRVYAADGGALQTFEPSDNDSNTWLVRDGLALDPSAQHLYAVTGAVGNGGPYRLHVIANPLASSTAMTVTAPNRATRGGALALSAHLTSAGAPVTGAVVQVVRHDASGATRIATPKTGSTGTVSLTDHPPVGGPVTYTFSWVGNSAYASAIRNATVTVSRAATPLTISLSSHSHAYGARFTVHAHVGRTFNGRTVTIYATPLGGTRHAVKTAEVDARGNLTATYPVVRRTKFTASFPGDYRYAPVARSTSAVVAAKLVTIIAQNSGTKGKYGLYSHTRGAALGGRVTPGKSGECLRFVLQKLTRRHWRTVASGCFTMDANSVAVGVAKGPTKTPFRNRVEYPGDHANSATHSKWYYIEFV